MATSTARIDGSVVPTPTRIRSYIGSGLRAVECASGTLHGVPAPLRVAWVARAPVDRSAMSTKTIERAALVIKRDLTLGTLFDRLEKVHGDRQLVTEADDGLSLTYAQAARRVRRWAAGIVAQAEPGDVVVVATPNGYEQLLLCCAVARAGRIAAPVNDQMAKDEVAHVVADSGATLVLRTAGSVDNADSNAPAHKAEPDDVAALFYTSGTTGKPKGAALTHKALVGQVASAVLWPTRLHRDEAVLALPVAHIMGFATLIGLAVAGIPCYLLPKFNP